MSSKIFQVLIADRNPNVLEFLRREFLREGYRVQMAKDGYDLCNFLRSKDLPDVLVLDPDLPYLNECGTLETLNRDHSDMPLILHALTGKTGDQPLLDRAKALVEKGGDPAHLMLKVRQLLIGKHSGEAEDSSVPNSTS